MIIEWDILLMELIDVNRNCRIKMSHAAFHRTHRNAPDAEKTKYMIDAESIKIITHLLKSFLPPVETIFRHLFPIVSGKTPVLSAHSKSIGRRASLKIHVI